MHNPSLNHQDVMLLCMNQATHCFTHNTDRSVLTMHRQFFRVLVLFFPPLLLLCLPTGVSSPRKREDGGEDF